MSNWTMPSDEMYDRINGLDRSLCQECGGLGQVAISNNRLVACSNPDCEAGERERAALADRMAHVSRIPLRYRGATLADFSLDPQAKRGKARAYQACELFARSLAINPVDLDHTWSGSTQPRNWLMLYGPVGTGKTYAACAAINHINRQLGQPARYVRLDDMLREVRGSYDNDAERSTAQVIQAYQEVAVLLLDEFNLAKVTEHTQEIVESIIRYRYMHDLPLLMTANTAPQEFAAMWGERIASPLNDKTLWLKMSGYQLRDGVASISDE